MGEMPRMRSTKSGENRNGTGDAKCETPLLGIPQTNNPGRELVIASGGSLTGNLSPVV